MAAYRSIAVAMVDAGEFRADYAAAAFRYIGTKGIAIPFTEIRPDVPVRLGWPVHPCLSV
jgi:hypothetical protein